MTQRPRRTLALLATLGVVVGLASATTWSTGAEPQSPGGASPRAGAAHVPRNVHVTDATTTTVTVAWDAPRGATRFRTAWSDVREMTDRQHKRTRQPHAVIRGLEPGSSTWVIVRVVRQDGVHRIYPHTTPIEAVTRANHPDPPTTPPPTTPPTPPPTPPPTTTATLFGANYTTIAGVDETVYANRAEAARIFFQGLGGVQFSRNGAVQEALADGVETFVISWKETDLAAIRTFLAGIPDDLTVYTVFNHEPEDDHGAPGSPGYAAWSAEYKRQWSLQSPVMRDEGTVPTNILMAWTLNPHSGRDVADWTPPPGTVDVFAFDAYYGKGKDPSALVDHVVAATAAAGLTTTGIGETGAPANDETRLAGTREMRESVIAAGSFAWALYWSSLKGTYDSRMDAATADAWFGD